MNEHSDIISTLVGGAILLLIGFATFVMLSTWIFS